MRKINQLKKNTFYDSIRTSGAPVSWINETFEKAWQRLPFELFERDPDYWYDVAHPRQINREGFVLTGLAYGVGEGNVGFLDQRLRDLITSLTSHEIDGISVPTLALLRDPARARNSLISFLAKDRGDALYLLLEKEDNRCFGSSALTLILEEALTRLTVSANQPNDWALIHAVLGDLPPTPELSEQLKRTIYQADFVNLFLKYQWVGLMAMQVASCQARNLNDDNLRIHLRGQVVQIAKLLAGKSKIDELPQEESTTAILMNLLEAALNLSVAVQPKGGVASEFAEITMDIVEACSATSQKYRPLIQRLCEQLPILEAKDLWPLLIRLRAD